MNLPPDEWIAAKAQGATADARRRIEAELEQLRRQLGVQPKRAE
jgi:hypothetical protein